MEDKEFDKHLKRRITTEQRNLQKVYLQSVEASLNTPKKKFNWRIAASIALLIGLGGYFGLFNPSLSNDELYTKYFYPYENVVAPIVRDQTSLSKKAQVFSFYEQEEYEKAIDGFSKLTTKDSIDVATITFYKANAYLKLNQFEKAKDLFSQVVKSKEWETESLWYLALTYLKLNETDAALKYLLILEDKSTFKNKEVKVLINSLN